MKRRYVVALVIAAAVLVLVFWPRGVLRSCGEVVVQTDQGPETVRQAMEAADVYAHRCEDEGLCDGG